jgi:hypothetical protein
MRNWKPFKGNFDKLSVIGNLLRVVLTRFLLDDLSSYRTFDLNLPPPNWGSLYLEIARSEFQFSCSRAVVQ